MVVLAEGGRSGKRAAGPEEVMRSDTVLMQDLDSSHGEVVLSPSAMMTTTQSAGLSAAAVE